MAVLLTQDGKNDEYFNSILFKNTNTRFSGGSNYMINENLPKVIYCLFLLF